MESLGAKISEIPFSILKRIEAKEAPLADDVDEKHETFSILKRIEAKEAWWMTLKKTRSISFSILKRIEAKEAQSRC